MRVFSCSIVSALIFSLCACDGSSSSTTSSDGTPSVMSDLVGNWKGTLTFREVGFPATDAESVTLSSNGTFSRQQIITVTLPAGSPQSTVNWTNGNWSATATKLILSDSTGVDTASYTLSGTNLTVVLLVESSYDTLQFTKQ